MEYIDDNFEYSYRIDEYDGLIAIKIDLNRIQ
jgi:hypothetical protein